MSNTTSNAIIPFTSIKLGPFELLHRIVISPPSHRLLDSAEDFYRACATAGGLVIAPFDSDASSRKNIAEIIHQANGVAFCLVDAPHDITENSTEELQTCITQAIQSGYDGIELDVSRYLILQCVLLNSSCQTEATSKLSQIVQTAASAVPEERLGIRFSPFAFVDSNYTRSLELYVAIIGGLKCMHPSLAFIHVLGSTMFEDFEYSREKSLDLFRAALTFPQAESRSTRFISSNSYTTETALDTSTRTGELVSFELSSLSNSNIVFLLYQNLPLQISPFVLKRLSDIRSAFEVGREYVFDWDLLQRGQVMKAMECLGRYLGQFEPALSYEGTDKKVVWRKSCWFASKGIAHSLLDTEAEISKFDGDLKDGLSGLVALRSADIRTSLEFLKHVLDSTLVSCCHAIGLNMDLIQRCTVRYRIIKYVAHAGNPGGIGLHPDGNLLSALITDGPGLGVYDFDGTYREPEVAGTILMGGSTLYRWSKGRYLPTFHDVNIGQEQKKTSIVAFFNLPDMENIPQSESVPSGTQQSSFFHDIRYIKEDDKSPTGELAALWETIVHKHSIVLPS
ncbi:hypothetical protein GGU10DRAFT_410897 [Lentinula aff. detonsa]|uniref:Fe2OG dioxygenase domain-containing protein n=1 Tax=Lentinula aff. detonsa TaxID=2804958 RepID=A0AA38KM06_9AGAR|nr:hypothetical protein GGU10DRAFT_410897 [Lentinula aff. detonsa]